LKTNYLTIVSICGTLCSANAGQFFSVDPQSSSLSTRWHRVNFTTALNCGGTATNQRSGIRPVNTQSMFVNLNVTSGKTGPTSDGGWALGISDGSFRIVFATVLDCSGWSMILNAGAGSVEIDRCNLVACSIGGTGGVISANTNGILVTNCVFKGASRWFYQGTASGTTHKVIGC
jgi:hypothetical protein